MAIRVREFGPVPGRSSAPPYGLPAGPDPERVEWSLAGIANGATDLPSAAFG